VQKAGKTHPENDRVDCKVKDSSPHPYSWDETYIHTRDGGTVGQNRSGPNAMSKHRRPRKKDFEKCSAVVLNGAEL
jgi:hypothetical protein